MALNSQVVMAWPDAGLGHGDAGDAQAEKPGVQVDVHPAGLLAAAPASGPEGAALVLKPGVEWCTRKQAVPVLMDPEKKKCCRHHESNKQQNTN